MKGQNNRRNFLKVGSSLIALPLIESIPQFAFAAGGQSKRVIFIVHHQGHYENLLFPTTNTYQTGAEGVRYLPLSSITGDVSRILTNARFANVRSKMNVLRGLDGMNKVSNVSVGHNQTYPLTAGSGAAYNPIYQPDNPNSIDTIISESNQFYSSVPFKRVMRVSPTDDQGGIQYRFCYKDGRNLGYTVGASNLFTEYFSTPVSSPSPTPVDTNLSRRAALTSAIEQVRKLASNTKMSAADQLRLRDHEKLITNVIQQIPPPTGGSTGAGCTQPTRPSPTSIQTNIRGIIDMMIAAFKCQLTNVAVLFPRHVSNTGDDDYFDPYHNNLFHSSPQDSLYLQLNGFIYDQISYLVNQMEATPEGTGTMLDNSLVVVLSEFGGHAGDHSGIDYSAITFGSLGGKIKTGNYINYQRPEAPSYSSTILHPYTCNAGRPLNHLHTTILNALGISHTGFGEYADPKGIYANFVTTMGIQANLPMLV